MIQIEVTRSRRNFPMIMDLLTILGFDTGDWKTVEDLYENYRGSDPIKELSNEILGTDDTIKYILCDWSDKSISVNTHGVSDFNVYSTDVDNVFMALRVPRSRMEFADLIKNFVESESNITSEAEEYFKHPRLQQSFYQKVNDEVIIRMFYPFELLALNNIGGNDDEWLPLTYEMYEKLTNDLDKRTQDYNSNAV